MPTPAPAGPYQTNLYTFAGMDPNGFWSLYVFDDTSGDGGGLSAWSLSIDWQTNGISIQNPKILGNGAFQAEVWGPPGITNVFVRTNVIQGSTNFVNWVPVATNLFTNPIPAIFRDSRIPMLPYRFYRVMQLP